MAYFVWAYRSCDLTLRSLYWKRWTVVTRPPWFVGQLTAGRCREAPRGWGRRVGRVFETHHAYSNAGGSRRLDPPYTNSHTHREPAEPAHSGPMPRGTARG